MELLSVETREYIYDADSALDARGGGDCRMVVALYELTAAYSRMNRAMGLLQKAYNTDSAEIIQAALEAALDSITALTEALERADEIYPADRAKRG